MDGPLRFGTYLVRFDNLHIVQANLFLFLPLRRCVCSTNRMTSQSSTGFRWVRRKPSTRRIPRNRLRDQNRQLSCQLNNQLNATTSRESAFVARGVKEVERRVS